MADTPREVQYQSKNYRQPLGRTHSADELVAQMSHLNTGAEPLTPPYSQSGQQSIMFPNIKTAPVSADMVGGNVQSSAPYYKRFGHFRSNSYSPNHSSNSSLSLSLDSPMPLQKPLVTTPGSMSITPTPRPRALSHGVFEIVDDWQLPRLSTDLQHFQASHSRQGSTLLSSPFSVKGGAGGQAYGSAKTSPQNPSLTDSRQRRPSMTRFPSGFFDDQPSPVGSIELPSGFVMPSANTPPSTGSIRSSRQSQSLDGPKLGGVVDAELPNLSPGEILAMCRDQRGCRSLQRWLQEQNQQVVHGIFEATHLQFSSLMMDPFGNYFCQKLVEHCNETDLTVIMQTVQPSMLDIALNQHGTRALQRLIEVLHAREQVEILCDALRFHVVRLIRDINGNHVVQKCLVVLDDGGNQFIYDSIHANIVEVGTHRHGCCVLQRCIDHAGPTNRHQLVLDIIDHALDLVSDPFGNYVCQYVLGLQRPEYIASFVSRILPAVSTLSIQKFSSNVIEKCLRLAPEIDQQKLVGALLNKRVLHQLLLDSYGNYVVQTALDASKGKHFHGPLASLVQVELSTTRTPYGRRIMSKLKSK